jgi:hypothetical protein
MMAHQITQQEIDEINTRASEAAVVTTHELQASVSEQPPAQTTLAYGAQGDCVQQLVELLNLLGHHTNTVIAGGPPILDQSVLEDLRAVKDELQIVEPESLTPAEIPTVIKGELVGQNTWHRLYEAAQAKIQASPPAGAASDASGSGAPAA